MFKLALKEIVRRPKVFLTLSLLIIVGCTGLLVLESFKLTFNDSLVSKSKVLLGADVGISSRLPLNSELKEKVRKYFGDGNQSYSHHSLFSMVGKKDGDLHLTSIQVVPNGFPFYGNYLVSKSSGESISTKIQLKTREVWIYKEVAQIHGFEIGDKVQIGSIEFLIAGVILDDPQQGLDFGVAAPKIFMNISDLSDSGLIKKGSTSFNYYSIKLSDKLSVKEIDNNQINELNNLINNTSIRVKTPKTSSDQVGRLLNILNDFLGISSLTSFLLAFIGVFYLFYTHVHQSSQSIGLFSLIGFSVSDIRKYFILQILIVIIFSLSISVILILITFPIISNSMVALVGEYIPLRVAPEAIALYLIGLILSFAIVAYPFLRYLKYISPLELFNSKIQVFRHGQMTSVWVAISTLLLVAIMSFILTRSLVVSSIFVLILLVLIIFSMPLYLIVLKLFSFFKVSSLNFLSYRYLRRNLSSTLTLFVSILFISFVIQLVPAINNSIQSELKIDSKSSPSFFLFDIQDEQVEKLKTMFENEKVNLIKMSPMVRGRVTKHNGKDYEIKNEDKIVREDQEAQRFRNRGINLSFAISKLSENEWTEQSDRMPYISIEKRYANRMGFKIGDEISFDILGVEVTGKIQDVRSVKWTSFLPNFFIEMEKNAIIDAPKTWLAAVRLDHHLSKLDFSKLLRSSFPNVSYVDIEKLVSKISHLINQMSRILVYMTWLTVIVGVIILFSILNHQLAIRSADFTLVEYLGVSKGSMFLNVSKELIFITIFAISLGSILAFISSSLVTIYVFNSDLSFGNFDLFKTAFVLFIINSLIITFLVKRSFISLSK